MGNMAHCRFENTCIDLEDCYYALDEAGGVKQLEEKANQYEKIHIRRLVRLCKEIINDFDELDNN